MYVLLKMIPIMIINYLIVKFIENNSLRADEIHAKEYIILNFKVPSKLELDQNSNNRFIFLTNIYF